MHRRTEAAQSAIRLATQGVQPKDLTWARKRGSVGMRLRGWLRRIFRRAPSQERAMRDYIRQRTALAERLERQHSLRRRSGIHPCDPRTSCRRPRLAGRFWCQRHARQVARIRSDRHRRKTTRRLHQGERRIHR
jgi:hypothetical protein